MGSASPNGSQAAQWGIAQVGYQSLILGLFFASGALVAADPVVEIMPQREAGKSRDKAGAFSGGVPTAVGFSGSTIVELSGIISTKSDCLFFGSNIAAGGEKPLVESFPQAVETGKSGKLRIYVLE